MGCWILILFSVHGRNNRDKRRFGIWQQKLSIVLQQLSRVLYKKKMKIFSTNAQRILQYFMQMSDKTALYFQNAMLSGIQTHNRSSKKKLQTLDRTKCFWRMNFKKRFSKIFARFYSSFYNSCYYREWIKDIFRTQFVSGRKLYELSVVGDDSL